MRRRRFLASGTAFLSVALAGCGHPPSSSSLNEGDRRRHRRRGVDDADPGSEEYELVTSALENGSATRRGRYELFEPTDTVRVDEAVYEVTETRIASSEVTVYEVLIDFDPADTTPELGEIAFDDLPEVDRERLEPIVSETDPPQQDGYDLGVGYGSAAEVGNESVFVPERRYDVLVHDGDRYRVVDSHTASEAEYRYEATEVAPDVETFADHVRERYLFVLAGLSDAEREVVEESIDGAYFEDDDAFRSVIDRIRAHDGIRVDDFYGDVAAGVRGRGVPRLRRVVARRERRSERTDFTRWRINRRPMNETTREAVRTQARSHRARLLSVLRVQYPDALADRGYRLIHPTTGDPYAGDRRHLIATCRSVANFAVGALADGPDWCLDAAEHGLQFLREAHRADDGGHLVVDAEGEPVDRTRSAYGHAFVLLAYARAVDAGIEGAERDLDATRES